MDDDDEDGDNNNVILTIFLDNLFLWNNLQIHYLLS
jgi:hypothetical protein